MTEALSATRLVYIWHRVVPVLIGTLVALGATYFVSTSTAPMMIRLLLLITPWLILVAAVYFGGRLKQVSLRDSCFVIPGKAGDVHVPVGHVESVVQSWSVNPSVVRLVLRKPHPALGSSVAFIPKEPTEILLPWRETELVRRLRRVCASGASTDSCEH